MGLLLFCVAPSAATGFGSVPADEGAHVGAVEGTESAEG